MFMACHSRRVETWRLTPDNACLTVGFADGGIVNIMSSFVVGGKDYYKSFLTLCGTKGIIYFDPGPRPREGAWESNLQLSTDAGIERQTVGVYSGEYDWEFFAQRVRREVAADDHRHRRGAPLR